MIFYVVNTVTGGLSTDRIENWRWQECAAELDEWVTRG